MLAALPHPMVGPLSKVGISNEYLAEKAKEELNAKETKAQIPKGGNEFIYSKPLIDWKTRQEARKDMHKLSNHYPAEKHEHYAPTVEDILRDIHEKRQNGAT